MDRSLSPPCLFIRKLMTFIATPFIFYQLFCRFSSDISSFPCSCSSSCWSESCSPDAGWTGKATRSGCESGRLPSLHFIEQQPPRLLSTSTVSTGEGCKPAGKSNPRSSAQNCITVDLRRDSCEMLMKHFSEDDRQGWPVRRIAARQEELINLLLFHWRHPRLFTHHKQATLLSPCTTLLTSCPQHATD